MRICNGYTYPTAWSERAWPSLPPSTRESSGDKKKRSGIMSRQAKGTESHSKDWVITLQRLSLYSVKSIESACYTVSIRFSFTRMVTDYHGLFLYVPNYRIIEFLFTRSSTENHGFSFHTECHGESRFFFLSTRNVTEYHGCFSLSRIIELAN